MNNNNLFNITNYRAAKLANKELSEILNIFLKTQEDLEKYKKYLQVHNILKDLEDAIMMVKIGLDKTSDAIHKRG
jgi:hypothetical protein